MVYKREKRGTRNAENAKMEFLLGKHSGYHKWVLPKGLIEKDEKPWQTAIRETEEEMGVKAKLLSKKPIYRERYVYWADLKSQSKNSKSEARNSKQISNSKFQTQNNRAIEQSSNGQDSRRVLKYQEAGGKKTKVFKVVTFYLLKYLSGDPKDHGWEMEKAGWFSYRQALDKLAFTGEKEALKKARKKISSLAEEVGFEPT